MNFCEVGDLIINKKIDDEGFKNGLRWLNKCLFIKFWQMIKQKGFLR